MNMIKRTCSKNNDDNKAVIHIIQALSKCTLAMNICVNDSITQKLLIYIIKLKYYTAYRFER